MAVETFDLENAGTVNHARGYRRAFASLVGGQAGVTELTGALVVAAGSGMAVTVSPGMAWVPSTDATHGYYPVYNDASANLTVGTAPGGGNSRIDLVVARVRDTEYGDASNGLSVEVVPGTAAATPTAPSTPSRALALAQVRVNSGVSSITSGAITDVRVVAGRAQFASKMLFAGPLTWPNNTAQAITFNGFGYRGLGGNLASFTALLTGIYRFTGSCTFKFNDARHRGLLMVYVNGVEAARLHDTTFAGLTTGDECGLSGGTDLRLNSGDVCTWRLQTIAKVGTNGTELINAFASVSRIG